MLFAGAFVNRLGTFVLPFITLYLTSRGYSVPQAGLGLAAYGLGAMGAQGIGGLLADRIGRRNAIALSSFGGAGLTLSLVWVNGLWEIVGVVALLGFVAELYRPASSALIADLIEPKARVAAFSAYRLALNLGFACGLSLGGSWRLTRTTCCSWATRSRPRSSGSSRSSRSPTGRARPSTRSVICAGAGRSMAADKGFLLVLGAVFVTAAVYMQNASTFALHVVALGYSTKVYGLLQAMNGVLVVLFELPISSLTQHRPRTRMIALGALLVGVGFAELAFVKALPGLLIMVVIWTLGEIIESPATGAFVADRAPEHARGRYQGALGMMYACAAVVGPLIGTSVYHVSPTALWIGCGLAGVGSAALALAAGRRPAPDHVVTVTPVQA